MNGRDIYPGLFAFYTGHLPSLIDIYQMQNKVISAVAHRTTNSSDGKSVELVTP